jgi:predicted amidophosphoribosyltransferase
MSPRILELENCPRCRAKLERPVPRVCPACGASLQKRFLTAGCLSSAPPLVLLGLGLWLAARALW